MARYCKNCGARLDGNPRFCGNCGRPCGVAGSRPPIRNSGAVRSRNTSSGFRHFLAGTAVGAFFGHLFGGSASASASHSTYAEPTEHYHDSLIYADGEDADYESHDDGIEDDSAYDAGWDREDSTDNDSWDTEDSVDDDDWDADDADDWDTDDFDDDDDDWNTDDSDDDDWDTDAYDDDGWDTGDYGSDDYGDGYDDY